MSMVYNKVRCGAEGITTGDGVGLVWQMHFGEAYIKTKVRANVKGLKVSKGLLLSVYMYL